MKKLLGALAFTLISSFALAHPHQQFYGKWNSINPIYNRDVNFYVGFRFSPSSVAMTVDCSFLDGAHLSATVHSRVNYFGNEIHVMQTQQTVAQDGYRFCRATLQPARWLSYFDAYGRLVLTVGAPYQTQFVLEKELELN